MQRIRVLLADDEPIIIRGLKKLISWEALGLDIVGEALDGKELISLIESSSPDLIISDISMPGYTGIDIIRQLHRSGRAVKVIFISAYEDFAYAQQALQYGALDYLVKPVHKGRLEEAVSRAVSVIHQELEEERDKAMLQHLQQQNRKVTLEELLDKLMDGNRSTAAKIASLGDMPQARFASVCVVATDEHAQGASPWEERERKLVEFALSNIIKETMDARGHAFVFRKGDKFGILLRHNMPDEPLERMQDLHGKIHGFLKLQTSIGIGTPAECLELSDESYRNALEALGRRFFEGLNSVYMGNPGGIAPDPALPGRLETLRTRLADALKGMEHGALSPLLEELLQAVSVSAQGNRSQAVSIVYNLILRLGQEFKDYGVEVPMQENHSKPLLDSLQQAPTFAELGELLIRAVHRIGEQLGTKVRGKELVLLSQVRAYVEEHYAENITLEAIASRVYMNPYYFSSFFKKHTGENFKTYITGLRMRQALRLLAETDLMIYEIAERVGYNNARHFSDIFKRRFGKLPQEYKQTYKKL